LFLVIRNTASANDKSLIKTFEATFSRVEVDSDTKIYMFICSAWFIGSIVMLFIAVELAHKSVEEHALQKSKWLGQVMSMQSKSINSGSGHQSSDKEDADERTPLFP